LRSLGFSSWKEIELDDGHWEIDDETLSILKQYEYC